MLKVVFSICFIFCSLIFLSCERKPKKSLTEDDFTFLKEGGFFKLENFNDWKQKSWVDTIDSFEIRTISYQGYNTKFSFVVSKLSSDERYYLIGGTKLYLQKGTLTTILYKGEDKIKILNLLFNNLEKKWEGNNEIIKTFSVIFLMQMDIYPTVHHDIFPPKYFFNKRNIEEIIDSLTIENLPFKLSRNGPGKSKGELLNFPLPYLEDYDYDEEFYYNSINNWEVFVKNYPQIVEDSLVVLTNRSITFIERNFSKILKLAKSKNSHIFYSLPDLRIFVVDIKYSPTGINLNAYYLNPNYIWEDVTFGYPPIKYNFAGEN